MTILKLIDDLQTLNSQYGDIEVKIANPEEVWVPITEIQTVTHYRPIVVGQRITFFDRFIGLGKVVE